MRRAARAVVPLHRNGRQEVESRDNGPIRSKSPWVAARGLGARCNAMLEALQSHFPAGAKWTKPEGGMFVWVELPPSVRAEQLLERALDQGVAFVPGAPFFAEAPRHNFMRLNFSNCSPEVISEGIKRLGNCLSSIM